MYTLAATSASSSLQWLATITSHLALKAARSCGAEELGRVERGLVHHHGHALGLDALHYALHARRAEVAAARLRGEAVHTHRGRQRAGVHELGHAREHLVGHEVLARAVGAFRKVHGAFYWIRDEESPAQTSPVKASSLTDKCDARSRLAQLAGK